MNEIKVIGYKNEGFFKVPLAINRYGEEINLYRGKRLMK